MTNLIHIHDAVNSLYHFSRHLTGPTLSPGSPACPSLSLAAPAVSWQVSLLGHVYPPSIALMWANRIDGRDRR